MNKMSARDTVALKRPTALDKLAETIPKPKGAIPNFGLPKWKVMPMESKIPMVPGPEGAYNFTRRKVGEGLWISAPDAEFNLSDPYCYEIKWTYDSLHDKHLIPYFSRPNIIRHLIKAGLITRSLDAKCSLKDYNMYRKYLRRLHCDSIKKELNRRGRQSREARALRYAQQQAEKEVARLKEQERLMKLRAHLTEQQKLTEQMKLQKQKEAQWKLENRLQALIQKKREEHRMRLIKREELEEIIRQKQKAAANRAQEKIIQTLLEWNKKERVRKKIAESRLLQEKEQKSLLIEQKWKEKQEFQIQQIEKEQLLMQYIEDQRKQFITAYKEKVEAERERMKKLFEDAKMYIQCYLARKLPGSREIICCKQYYNQNDVKKISHKDDGTNMKKRDRYKVTQYQKHHPRKGDLGVRRAMGKKGGRKKHTLQQKKIPRGSKKRKRRNKALQEEAESEAKTELEIIPQSVPTIKSGTTVASSTSEPKDMCKCQMIKDARRNSTAYSHGF